MRWEGWRNQGGKGRVTCCSALAAEIHGNDRAGPHTLCLTK